MIKAAWIGLGVMGFPHGRPSQNARRPRGGGLQPDAREGRGVRRPRRRRAGRHAHEAAQGADFVFACTGNDDDLRAIALGPSGAFAALGPGSVFVDHTTASPGLARELAAAAHGRGAAFLDAPVSGGEEGAKRGALSVMVGGEAEALERARPLLAAYAKQGDPRGARAARASSPRP